MNKIWWVLVRCFIYGMGISMLLTFGLIGYIIGPILSYTYFNDWRFWRHHRKFIPMTIHAYYIMFKWLADREYRNMFVLQLIEPPLSGPDSSIVGLTNTWLTSKDNCNTCAQCCTKIYCPLINPQTNLCSAYNSTFWRYFNCGRYPMSDKQIEYYSCPKWEMLTDKKKRA